MRIRLIPILFLTVLPIFPSGAQSQTTPPAFLADVTSSVMKASATGRTYQISVALPDGYSKQHVRYPVLYAADANAEFGTVVETARTFAEIPELVIVGIGYPNPGQGFKAAWVPRALDLTTTPNPKEPGTNGGATEFLQFIRGDLVPYIENTYNVSQDRAWFGHSFGGLFGIYALFNNDGLFRRFIVGSPSLWQGKQTIQAAEKSFAATGKPLPAKVFFSVGLLEQSGNAPGGMVGDLREFIGTLEQRHYKGFEYQVHYFEEETHYSVIPGTIGRGLRYIYAPASPNAPRK
jgi:predicted alpha/beta superfamily hydrolase